nr:hypothetical protein [Candidatus Koribacter versatilis]
MLGRKIGSADLQKDASSYGGFGNGDESLYEIPANALALCGKCNGNVLQFPLVRNLVANNESEDFPPALGDEGNPVRVEIGPETLVSILAPVRGAFIRALDLKDGRQVERNRLTD